MQGRQFQPAKSFLERRMEAEAAQISKLDEEAKKTPKAIKDKLWRITTNKDPEEIKRLLTDDKDCKDNINALFKLKYNALFKFTYRAYSSILCLCVESEKLNHATKEILRIPGIDVNMKCWVPRAFSERLAGIVQTSALIRAALFGNFDMVKELVLAKANIDQVDTMGHTAFIAIAMRGYKKKKEYLDVAKFLIDQNANLFYRNIDGMNGLDAVFENDQSDNTQTTAERREIVLELANYIFDKGMKDKSIDYMCFAYKCLKKLNAPCKEKMDKITRLRESLGNGKLEAVEVKVESKGDSKAEPSTKAVLSMLSQEIKSDEENPAFEEFLSAVATNKLDKVKELVESKKINVNTRYAKGQTLLFAAVRLANLDVIKYLIDMNANTQDIFGTGIDLALADKEKTRGEAFVSTIAQYIFDKALREKNIERMGLACAYLARVDKDKATLASSKIHEFQRQASAEEDVEPTVVMRRA